MNANTVSRFPAHRAKRIRALYEMVRNKADWKKPISAALDEPAVFAYLPDPHRQAARESMMRELQEAVAFHTGETASVFVAVNGNTIRYHVRAPGYHAPQGSAPATKLFE